MARRYELITELYERTRAALTSPQEWQRFLATACRNYKLPFDEQLLLFAQRPDATAVLEIERWNKQFGRWVNRGATGIAVFDRNAPGRARLKYYFDISDTHPGRFARPVPLWQVRPEYEAEITEALENSFGELADKSSFAEALLSAAKNAVEDNLPDYLTELKYYKENSVLEELDDFNLEVTYRDAVRNSAGYMLLARCGIDPTLYFTDDDFRTVIDFNTPQVLNALGVATGDIGQMCLSEISRTVTALDRQAALNRTVARLPEESYPIIRNEIRTQERSDLHERDHIHDAGWLPASGPAASAGAGGDDWEIRPAAQELPQGAPQGDVYEPADQRQADGAPAGDRADRQEPGRADHGADGTVRGRDGAAEDHRPDEVGGPDEQYPAGRGGDRTGGADLQLNAEIPEENAGTGVPEKQMLFGERRSKGAEREMESETDSVASGADFATTQLPAFLDEELIGAILSNPEDDLKYKKAQIEMYFAAHSNTMDRADYLKSAYPDRFTELLVGEARTRVGCHAQEDGLLMWEGSYLSRTSESVFSWQTIAELTAQIIDKGEYRINRDSRGIKTQEAQQLSLFDFADFVVPEQAIPTEPVSYGGLRYTQQVIDEALCIGANDKNSRLIVCAHFMKDKPLADNARFLMEHYGENGAGFYLDNRKYAIWYDAEGIRLSSGDSAQGNAAMLISWEEAARRIRELLDAGRYMSQAELDRVEDFESQEIADSLWYLRQDFSEEAREKNLLPEVSRIHASGGGFPEQTAQIKELLKQPETLQGLVEELRGFIDAYEDNHDLLRFRFHRPRRLLERLADLQREPVRFTAAGEHSPNRRFFISLDEIDRLLRGGTSDYRLGVYAFFLAHEEAKEQEQYLRSCHGEYSGFHGGNDNTEYTGKGVSFSHGSITAPYARLDWSWNKAARRIASLIESNRFLSDKDRAAMPEYERRDAISNLHAEITACEMEELEEDEEDRSIPADPTVRNFSFCLTDGDLYFRENSRMYPVEVSVTAENRIRGMIAIRDCVRRLIELQTEDYPEADIQAEQGKLNRLYDDYTARYGRITSRGNRLAFGEDASYCLLCSLEVLDEEGVFERKADMFTRRTIRPHVPVTTVDTASEALAVSISEKAQVDMAYMEELSGKTAAELETELSGVIFRDIRCAEEATAIPDSFADLTRYSFVTADEYLSGNLRRKLRMAKALAEARPDLAGQVQGNITALEAVQPADLTAGEIGVRIGVNWIPTEIYEQFMYELLGTGYYGRDRIHILHSKATGEWNITNKNADSSNVRSFTTYGTRRVNAYHILEQTLNQKDVRIFDYIYDEDGNKRPVLNKKETAIAQDRQELIKAEFAGWVWKDIDRREQLCRIYNETFNSIRPREYDGQHIRFSGMNPEITLRKHQIDAIAHIMYGGNTLLAHEVGAGKTYEMVAAAMESKRLGLCTKSLIVVPNHITEQWSGEWLQLYPSANILVATKKDFETKNRKKFCARIATGDYDAVIIGHSQFEKIPMSAERQEIIIQRQIDEIMDGIDEARRAKAERYTVKQLERTKKSLEVKMARLNDQSRKDSLVTFEELGVDRVFIDESHFFKNLFLATKMRNVGGIAQTEAQKSSDLFMKCQYLDEITGGRGIVFATGTPISNSMVELYTIQRYLQYHTLEEMDMLHFDDWAAAFGETITAIELSPEGSGYRAKTRFAKFYNLPELMSTFKLVADIQTADMLKLPVPKANFHTEVIKLSEIQQEMITGLAGRAEKIRAGGMDPRVDNMLRITNDGRKLALDMRLINPLAADDPEGKVSVCAGNVFRIWEQTAKQRGTQLVFCDLSTPKGDGSFNVYDDLKNKLMAAGVPEGEIAYIHDANTEARKKELFAKVRAGQTRILMGSTQKMGAGTNVQDRLVALHDLDCPWRPSDLAQRLGRIVRQGNGNEEVDIYRYVTEGTFDAYLYQLVENKQKFIAQIMTSKSPVRVTDDIDETALSYSEIKALATGNPLIIEKCNLDMEVGKLNVLKASHLSQKYALEEMVLKKYPKMIQNLKQRILGYEQDAHLAGLHQKPKEGFAGITLMGKEIAEKEDAGKAIIDVCTTMTGSGTAEMIGEYRGFSLSITYDGAKNEYQMHLKGTLSHTAVLGADVYGNITRIDNLVDGISGKLDKVRSELADTEKQMEAAKEQMNVPFAKEAELKEKETRLKELNILLNMDEKDRSLIDEVLEEEPEPVKSREHAFAR